MNEIRRPVGSVVVWCVVAATLLGAEPIRSQEVRQDALRKDLEYARRKVYPTLVNIAVVSKVYSGGRTVRYPAAGSGVVVSPAGHVLTNYHVAEKAAQIHCTLPTGEVIAADVVAEDPPTDVTVLKLRLESRSEAAKPVLFATLGDSDALTVGDYVLAVGNPLSLSSSMTLGIVSNPRRVFTNFTGTEIEELEFGGGNQTGMFTQWIQHDALILPGNSGGPLVNLRGEIVGINTRGGSGVGFATPSNLVSTVLNQILTYGEVRRGWLGISVIPVNKLGLKAGALVASVVPSSPAAKAGIEPGDVLLDFGANPLEVRFFEEVPPFYQRVAATPPGTEVSIRLRRGEKKKSVKVKVERMARFVGDEVEVRKFGICVQEITVPMAQARRYPDSKGVLITSVRPGQLFENARPRILPGDVVRSLDGKAVEDLEAFLELVGKLVDEDADKDEVAVAYRRNRESILTVVELELKKRPDPGGELAKAWLGVKTQVLTPPVSKALGLDGVKGFRVTEVFPWTKAAAAGLLSGDILRAIEDEELDAFRPQDAKDLQRAIEEFSVGEEVELTLARDGEEVKLNVELEESPLAVDTKKTTDDFLEMTVREVEFLDKIANRWPRDQKGVIVVESTSGGWANMGGLLTGDLIASINEKEVSGLNSFEKVLQELSEAQPKILKFFLRRSNRTTFAFIEPDWSKQK